jgi:hypothetical protein
MSIPHNTPTSSATNSHDGQTAADTCRFFRKPPVCPYNRKQALAAGLQTQVTAAFIRQMHDDWDMLLPSYLFLTNKVIETWEIPIHGTGSDEKGRLWDIANVLDNAIGSWVSPLTRISFRVRFGTEGRTPIARLDIAWTTLDTDDPRPAFTVMLPEEVWH